MPDIPASDERKLDDALADTFPASDPPAKTIPDAAKQERATTHITLYRIVALDDAEDAFVAPSAPAGGRWTSAGAQVVYASLSPACALLEYLAHLDTEVPHALRLIVAGIPTDSMLPVGDLPDDWDAYPYRSHVQQIGDRWLEEGKSLAMSVPSALSPRERNILINLRYGGRAELGVLSHDTLHIDPRLRR